MKTGIVFFTLLSFMGVLAQEPAPIDSLKQQLPKETDNLKKIHIMDRIAFMYDRDHVDSILSYAQKIKSLSEKENYAKGKNLANFNFGTYYFYTSDYEQAIAYFLEHIKGSQEIDDKKGASSGYNMLAGCYYQKNNLFMAIEYLNKAVEIAYDVGHDDQISSGLTNMASIYYELKNYEKAIEYNKKYQEFKNCDPYFLFEIFALCYLKLDNLDEAMLYAQKLDSVLHNNVEDYDKIANLNLIYGDIQNARDSLDTALEHYNKSIAIHARNLTANKESESELLFKAAEIHFKKQEYDSALTKAGLSHDFVKKINLTEETYRTSKLLFDIHTAMGQEEKALGYLKTAMQYADSVSNPSSVKSVYQKMIHFQQERAQEEEENEVRINKIDSYRQLITVFIGSIPIIFIIFFYINRKLKVAKKKVEVSVHEKLTLENKMNAVEKDIASSFQENFGNNLTDLIASFKPVNEILKAHTEKKDAILDKYSANLEHNLNRLIEDTGDLLWASSLENNNITSLLQQLRKRIKRFNEKKDKKIVFTADHDKAYPLPKFAVKQLLFTFKEIINNFDKHAKTNLLTITLAIDESNLAIHIADNDLGLDLHGSNWTNSLKNIIKRMNSLNLSTVFVSSKDKGTTIIIEGNLLALQKLN